MIEGTDKINDIVGGKYGRAYNFIVKGVQFWL